jgi:hypothetical protein
MSSVLSATAAVHPRPTYEVADVFRLYGAAYREQHPLPLSSRP